MKIESVTISGMHHIRNKTYNFGNVNYLHGRNGAGKSTILEAIQLAILGYIPGTAKQTSAIFQHASAPEMKIRVIFDDGRVIERSWRSKGRTIETKLTGNFTEEAIKDLIKDLELPIFNFNELINLTANKLKDWFINFLPSNSINIDWRNELLNSLNGLTIMDPEILDRALEMLQNEDQALLEKIQTFNKMMKEYQSYYKSELQRSESTIQSLIYYDEDGLVGDAEYLEGEIQNSRNQIQELTSQKEDVIRAQQIRNSNHTIQHQIDTIPSFSEDEIANLTSRSKELSQEITALQDAIPQEQSQAMDISSEISALKLQISSKNDIIQSNGMCPYTRTTCDSITKMIEEFQKEIATAQEKINNLSQQYEDIRTSFNVKTKKMNDLQRELQGVQQRLDQSRTTKDQIARLKSMLQSEPEISSSEDLSFYSTEIVRLNQQISKIEANKQYNALVDKLTAEKYQLENSIEVYKCWAKLTDPNGLQTKVMDAPFQKLAEDMNKYLSIMFSGDVRCNFNLEQRANSFSFGIIRDNKYIPYDLLSSGEKTMYTLALMLCIVNRTDNSLKILIVDDMLDHLDDERADEVFTALREIQDIQVIVAGVKKSESAYSYTINVL